MSVEVFKIDLMTRNLPNLVTEPDLTQLQKRFTIMLKAIWTQNPISNRLETSNSNSTQWLKWTPLLWVTSYGETISHFLFFLNKQDLILSESGGILKVVMQFKVVGIWVKEKDGVTMLMRLIQLYWRSCQQTFRKNFVIGFDLRSSIILIHPSAVVLLPISYRPKAKARRRYYRITLYNFV